MIKAMRVHLPAIRNTFSRTSIFRSKVHAFRTYTMASSCQTPSTTKPVQPVLSSTYDPTRAIQDLTPLLQSPTSNSKESGKWALTPNGKGIERSFKFKTFKKTWVCTQNISYHLISYHIKLSHLFSFVCTFNKTTELI